MLVGYHAKSHFPALDDPQKLAFVGELAEGVSVRVRVAVRL